MYLNFCKFQNSMILCLSSPKYATASLLSPLYLIFLFFLICRSSHTRVLRNGIIEFNSTRIYCALLSTWQLLSNILSYLFLPATWIRKYHSSYTIFRFFMQLLRGKVGYNPDFLSTILQLNAF